MEVVDDMQIKVVQQTVGTTYGPQGGSVFISALYKLFVCLFNILPHFLLSLCFLSCLFTFLFTSYLIYLLPE